MMSDPIKEILDTSLALANMCLAIEEKVARGEAVENFFYIDLVEASIKNCREVQSIVKSILDADKSKIEKYKSLIDADNRSL